MSKKRKRAPRERKPQLPPEGKVFRWRVNCNLRELEAQGLVRLLHRWADEADKAMEVGLYYRAQAIEHAMAPVSKRVVELRLGHRLGGSLSEWEPHLPPDAFDRLLARAVPVPFSER